MIFQPKNKHVEVKPLETQSIISSKDVSYEEKGTVMSIADDVTKVTVGVCAYFDSWQAAKFTDSNGETRWLVPEEAIRAIEHE